VINMLESLANLAIKYKTDKEISHIHHGEGHKYCNFYDLHLSSIRSNNLKIFEIGIFDGASLRMWKEYFYNSEIYGVDILKESQCVLINEERIRSFKLDAGNIDSLTSFANEYGPFDIVIDDGSHFTNHQWISWDIFSDNCKVFIWEDLHTSRMPHYMRGTKDDLYPLDFAKKLSQEDPLNSFIFDRDGDEKHVTFLRKNI